MVDETREKFETPEEGPKAPAESLTPRGVGAMQGIGDAPPPPAPAADTTSMNKTPPIADAQLSSDAKKTTADELQAADTPAGPVETLPDGRLASISGQPKELEKYNHLQGKNESGYQGTCGIVACEDVINQNGKNVTENDLVKDASAKGLCETEDPDPGKLGGTSAQQQVEILKENGVPAHVETGKTLDDLAGHIEQNKGVIIEANAGELWQDANYYGDGRFNHAVVGTGVARDPENGSILGFYINDSGTNEAGKFVDAGTMKTAWQDVGGVLVVTDKKRPGQ